MKYAHDTITIEQPAPGHYAVRGLPAQTTFVEGTGHVVAPTEFYISPAVPDDLLEHILADRRAQRDLTGEPDAHDVPDDEPVDHPDGGEPPHAEGHPAKPRRGRPAGKGRHL